MADENLDTKLERRESAELILKLMNGQAEVSAQLKALENIPVILAKLVATVDGLYNGCPHREAIARGQNNIKRVEKLEQEVSILSEKQHDDRLLTTKSLAKIALVVAVSGMVGANVDLSGLLGVFG